jgi:hypothetical protein
MKIIPYPINTFTGETQKELLNLLDEYYQKGRVSVIKKIKKSKKQNMFHLCKATSCSDPICGHSRCIDWMYNELLEELK